MINEQLALPGLAELTPVPSRRPIVTYVGARGGQIKIGKAFEDRLDRRMNELQLTLLVILEGDEERRLHRRWRRYRIDREWFMPAPELLHWIVHVPHDGLHN